MKVIIPRALKGDNLTRGQYYRAYYSGIMLHGGIIDIQSHYTLAVFLSCD